MHSNCKIKDFNVCCCICKRQQTLYKHPWNDGYARGNITDVLGYACRMPEFDEDRKTKVSIFFDDKHGMCECFERKEIDNEQ